MNEQVTCKGCGASLSWVDAITDCRQDENVHYCTSCFRCPPAPPQDTIIRSDGARVEFQSTNPKDKIGRTKPPLELIPPSGLVHVAMAFKNGAAKYGPYNWRDEKVSAMVYLGAALRHISAIIDGEDVASDSQCKHAAHAAACMFILIDAQETGNLIDDRPKAGVSSALIAKFTEVKP